MLSERIIEKIKKDTIFRALETRNNLKGFCVRTAGERDSPAACKR